MRRLSRGLMRSTTTHEGTDSGEFVEFAAPEGFDATGWRFQLINGTTGAVYAANQLVNLTKTTSGGLDRTS